MNVGKTVSDLGEKEIIRSIIKPALNPENDPDLPGDDCAVLRLSASAAICVSTDRVPADLISFRLGLIDHFGLGYYLVVLNLSDIAAMGAEPIGILLNLGLPASLPLGHLEQILAGAKQACQAHNCRIVGGDLSSSQELSISATSIGRVIYEQVLRRIGTKLGDYVYCSGYLGLTSTAFHYYLVAKPGGMRLSDAEEAILANQFRKPAPRFELTRKLRDLPPSVTCMDNTDGAGQTLIELSEINQVAFLLQIASLPIHEVSQRVARYLNLDVLSVALGSGADFQLLGTVPPESKDLVSHLEGVCVIGEAIPGQGIWVAPRGTPREIKVSGWNYFSGTSPWQSLLTELQAKNRV